MSEFKAGLEGVVAFETEIAEPDKEGSALRYRGVDINQLVGVVPYEQVWGLLVDGTMEPGLAPDQPLAVPVHSGDIRVDLQSALAMLAPYWGFGQLLDIDERQARQDLARASATSLSFVAQAARGLGLPVVPEHRVDEAKTIAERFLVRWRGEPDPVHVRAVDAYWVTAAEHGMNASTFTARVVASTGADGGACLSAAVGALSGPLHGGAPARVLTMLDEVERVGDAGRWVKGAMDRGDRLMGFGHRVYRAEDPRARVLRRIAKELESPRYEVAAALEQAALEVCGVARYIGDPVALVIATTDAAAQAAVKLVEVEYTSRPAVLDPEQAQDVGAPEIHVGAQRNVAARIDLQYGDATAAFDSAAATVRSRFSTSKQKQAQLELTCAIAEPDPDGGVIVWSPSQSPHRARHTLARAFGLRYTDVRVINPVIGGAFGKGDSLTAEPYAVAAALMTQCPVKVRYDRHEDFVGTESRHPSITDLEAAVRSDGTIAALRGRVLLDGGAYLSHSPRIAAVVIKQLAGVYEVEAVDLTVTVVFTNTPVSGAFRGYGGPQAAFPLEHLVDLGAREVGVAPLAARRAMLARVERKSPGSRAALLACLEQGEQRIGAPRPTPDARYRRGMGVAAITWKSGIAGKPGAIDQSGATVRVNADGTVDVLTAACDLGTGATTALAQIAADALGVAMRDVRIPPVDTAMTSYDSGAFASRTLYRAGRAVHDAALVVREEILDHAGGMLEAAAADLELGEGVVAVRGAPARSVPLREVLRDAMFAGRAFLGSAQSPQTVGATAAAHFAVVDVDLESGQVLLRRLVAVQDVGRAINPGIVEGQIAGAAYQGLGYALTENLVVDRSTGEVLTGTFMDYRVPTVADGPRIEAHIVEFPDPEGPFGAKGAGEASIILPAPAVANAVLDAVGVSLTELPITPERVWQALMGNR